MTENSHRSIRGKLTVVGVIAFGLLIYGLLVISRRVVKPIPASEPSSTSPA